MKYILIGLLAILGLSTKAHAQEEPKGKAVIQVFGNFYTGFGADNDSRGFALERSYVGYEYNAGNGLTIKGVMDMGKSSDVSDNHRIAYIKNALVQWKTGNLTLNGGLIPTTQFNFQEKFWGYRYVMDTFQGLYKYGSSADLGISASYKFADWVTADAIIVNGEGYKKLQVNDGLNYGLGLTLNPFGGLNMRFYAGINEASNNELKDKVNLAALIGYKADRFSVGAEYNFMKNASYVDGADQSGYSIFTTVVLSEMVNMYARFDDLYSSDDWNIAGDKSVAILGAQVKLGKFVKLAPNFRLTMPKLDGVENAYAAYVNFYFAL